ILIAIGFSPYFFVFKDFILSEVVFLAFLYVTLVLFARLEGAASNPDLPLRAGVWLGLAIGLCVATRTVGVVLLPTLVAYSFVRFRRVRRASAVALTIAVLAIVLQLIFVDFFNDYLANVAVNKREEARSLGIGAMGNNGPVALLANLGSM